MKIIVNSDVDETYYATIQRLYDDYYLNTSDELFYETVTFNNKKITLTEGDDENQGTYEATIDSSDWDDGLYYIRIHNATISLAGKMVSLKDGIEVQLGQESNIFDVYHADIQFTRDNVGAVDEYTITWFINGKIATHTTPPTLKLIRRSDGTTVFDNNTTQIGSTQHYKLNSNDLQTPGEAYIAISTADLQGQERTFSWILGRDAL